MPRSGPVRCLGERRMSMRANVVQGPSLPRGARSRQRRLVTPSRKSANVAVWPHMPPPTTSTSTTPSRGMRLNRVPKHYPQDGRPLGWNKPPGWMVIAAQERGLDAPRLSHALLRALWAEERDTSDTKVRIAIANENGMPGAELQKDEMSEPVQRLYKTYGEEAERLGVFGAPTYVLNGERFWGQDRLDFLERALASARHKPNG